MTVESISGRWAARRRRDATGDLSPELEFKRIVETHQALVYSICLYGLGDPGRAEELAQEVFLKLYTVLDTIESDTHLVRWLRRTATHRVIDAIRAHRPRVSLEQVAEPGRPASHGDPLLRESLRSLVAELPPSQRIAIVLRFGDGLKLREIAETLDLPLNTVKSNLRRGLEKLRSRLEERWKS